MRTKKKKLLIILLVIVLGLVAYMGYLDGNEDANEDVVPDTELEVKD